MVEEATKTQPDPRKSFRGVMAGALVLEAITVALALPVIVNLGDGVSGWQGGVVLGIIGILLASCGFLRRPFVVIIALLVQVALLAFFVVFPAIAIIGLLFLGIWLWLLWLRREVERRIARYPASRRAEDSIERNSAEPAG